MTIEHHDYKKGGCEARIGQDGNELTDWEVTIHYCNEPAVFLVNFFRPYKACEEHARKWQDRFSKEIVPIEEVNNGKSNG